MLKLTTLAPERYVREVLPLSRELWAGARSFEQYADDFRGAAAMWGTRRFRTVGLEVDAALAASCKRYERVLRCGERAYRAAGIGAVFTPPDLRGRGYATALLGALLDAERAAGTDLAYLFSDIHPAFYERIGFVALPSRLIALRADRLPAQRTAVVTLDHDEHAAAMRRCFEQCEARRAFAFRRTTLDWEWLRLRRGAPEYAGAQLALGVLRGRSLAAYVSGRRVPGADAFALDEFAYAREDDAPLVAPLLRAAAGDLRKIQGWLPPAPARDALPAGAVRRRIGATAMLVPLSNGFRAAWRNAAPQLRQGRADAYWAGDHV